MLKGLGTVAIGLPLLEEMSGAVRTELLASDRKVARIPTAELAGGRSARWSSAGEEDDAAVLERLRALGYTDGLEDEDGQ